MFKWQFLIGKCNGCCIWGRAIIPNQNKMKERDKYFDSEEQKMKHLYVFLMFLQDMHVETLVELRKA